MVCGASLLGKTRGIKPSEADGKSKPAKGGAARQLGNRKEGTRGGGGISWRLETGAAAPGLDAVRAGGPAVFGEGIGNVAATAEQGGQ